MTHSTHHVSVNVTHLPSKRAILSWLGMAASKIFVRPTACAGLRKLGRDRAASTPKRPQYDGKRLVYAIAGLDYETAAVEKVRMKCVKIFGAANGTSLMIGIARKQWSCP